MQQIAKIVFPYVWSNAYDYACNELISIGDVVQVKLKNRNTIGLVIELSDTTEFAKINSIIKVLYHIDVRFVDFLKDSAIFYNKSIGYFTNLALKTLNKLPSYLSKDHNTYTVEQLNATLSYQTWLSQYRKGILIANTFANVVKQNPSTVSTGTARISAAKINTAKINTAKINTVLDQEQSKIVELISNAIFQLKYQIILLDGETGSGKTEVYLEAIAQLSKTKQVLILLPEILLTTSFSKRFERMYGVQPLMWHSKISKSGKDSIYSWAIDPNSSGVLIGARSALFVPFANLGCVIIDEEHDGSYKQEFGYHTKQCAMILCQKFECSVVYVSATPSFEYLQNKPDLTFSLKRKIKHGLAKVHLIDMKGVSNILSKNAIHALEENLRKKELSLVFLNRKGFSPIVFCTACDQRLVCKNCSVGMVFYKTGYVVCHYCAYHYKMPEKCNCGGAWKMFGLGIEKVAETIKKLLPNASVEIAHGQMSKKSMEILQQKLQAQELDTGKIDTSKIDTKIDTSKIDTKIEILVGTQIMAQGHHIKQLSLVIMLDADFSMSCPSYNAFENTYQLINQLRGRCGREDIPGRFMIQTHFPNNPLLQAIKNDTQDQWKIKELENRKKYNWPPFCKLCSVIVSGSDKELVKKGAKELVDQLNSADIMEVSMKSNIQVLGPVPAPLHKLETLYRYRILIKYMDHDVLLQKLKFKHNKDLNVVVDIDPENFM